LINIFLLSFFSSVYLICAGSLFYHQNIKEINEIYSSIFFGSCILAFIGVLFNFYTPLNTNINTIIFFIILVIGFFLILKKGNLYKVIYCSILISFISTLILSYDTIYRPDASLYHLPFTQIINENKVIFGISNIHFRFGHISVLQYLNAIFNNVLFNEKGILIPAAIIFSSVVLYFSNEITRHFKKNKIYTYFIFLILAYILYGYNRYSEFGNDTIAHLFFFIICSFFLKDDYEKDVNTADFTKILILSLFCFMLKTSLIFVFIIPFYIFIFYFKKEFIFNFSNILIILITLSWFAKNIIISGCLIYPVEITCFEEFSWFSNDLNHLISAKAQSLDNEAWTKGWPDYKGPSVTQEKYVENFYWLQTWLSVHGLVIFKKISIFLAIILILNFSLKKIKTDKTIKNIRFNKKIYFLFLLSLILVLIWFIRFPLFRYGSSYIVVLIICLSTIFAIKNYFFNKKIDKFQKYLKICMIIFFVLFSLKHALRIYKNYDNLLTDNAWPEFPKKEDTKNISKPISLNGKFAYYLLIGGNEGCGYTLSPCTPFSVKSVYQKEINGYKFFLIEK